MTKVMAAGIVWIATTSPTSRNDGQVGLATVGIATAARPSRNDGQVGLATVWIATAALPPRHDGQTGLHPSIQLKCHFKVSSRAIA